MTNSEAQDKILKYLCESEKNFLTVHDIKEGLFNSFNDDEIIFLLKEIGNKENEIADVRITEYNSIIVKTGLTKKFLEQGGFTFIEYEQIKDETKIKEQKELDFKKSKIDLELAEKMLKEYPKTKWQARIGITIAILLALKELYIWIMQLQSQ